MNDYEMLYFSLLSKLDMMTNDMMNHCGLETKKYLEEIRRLLK